MDASEYQRAAARTLEPEPGFEISDTDNMIIWCALGLGGESGEALDHVKKGILHQHGLDAEKLKEELGDVLWYIAGLCTLIGADLGEVMQANVDKLIARYPSGFNSDDSINRAKKNILGIRECSWCLDKGKTIIVRGDMGFYHVTCERCEREGDPASNSVDAVRYWNEYIDEGERIWTK